VTQVTGAPRRAEGTHRSTAALLAAWIEEHQELLRGLSALRALGPEADEAVQSVLKLRKLRTARLSWELWASFTTADGFDADALLLEYASIEAVRLGRMALLGTEPVRLTLVRSSSDTESGPR
jgi:hypothetical protein